MAHIEKFLGRRVEIPEDLRYELRQGLWARQEENALVFGLAEPTLVLAGGLKDLDWLVEDGEEVKSGQSVLFAITGKVLYIDTPAAGILLRNPKARENPGRTPEDPYGEGWLFRVQPSGVLAEVLQRLATPQAYIERLLRSEGCKNPEGVKGGVSGICKAVYSGIGAQKL